MSSRVNGLFKGVVIEPVAQASISKRPLPDKGYVIYFTPRSGSSWLTDVLESTKRLGRANEVFNPNFVPNIAQSCQAGDLEQYTDMIQRYMSTNGVFSFEITWHQMQVIFPDTREFYTQFGSLPSLWLIRRDIVEQAVSLAKMVTTKVAHSPQSQIEARSRAEQIFSYDRALIRKWLMHILVAERGTEKFLAANDVRPLRICYEDMMALGADGIIDVITKHIGIPELPRGSWQSSHEKLGTSQNQNFAKRFREEEAEFISDIERERAPMLVGLNDISNFSY